LNTDFIFKTIQTRQGNYIYDRHTNTVFSVPDADFAEFIQIEKGELSPLDSPCFSKYQEQGVLQKNVVTEIENPSTHYLEHFAYNRLYQLTLQVTQQCNLRCAYCIYSGLYNNSRQHANKRMDFETAKKAIDFFINKTRERNRINIGFYGGEPLLEFDLIKKCVSYAKEMVEGKEVDFIMTTNGTLLTGEIARFVVENDFKLTISLDGSKREHDANRKFSSGKGSFDTIMGNVRQIRKEYPEYAKKISFTTVVNPKADLGCVMEFFQTDDILSDSYIMFSEMEEKDLKNAVNYDESFYLIRNYEYFKMLLMLVGKISRDSVSKLMLVSHGQYELFHQTLHKHFALVPKTHHGGPCLPGIKRLFVTTDGKFLPCEKVSETLDYFYIGSAETGFEMDKMKNMINNGKVTAEECKNCWNLSNCMICSVEIEFGENGALCKANKLPCCTREKKRVWNNLYELCVLREHGYDIPQTGDMPV